MWIELLLGDLFFALQELGRDALSVVEKDFGASIGIRAWRIVVQQERKTASASTLRLDACVTRAARLFEHGLLSSMSPSMHLDEAGQCSVCLHVG